MLGDRLKTAAQPDNLLHLVNGDLERRVLGTILGVGEPAYREVASLLTVDDFAIEKHKIIFGAISRIAPELDPTLNAVVHALMENGQLDAVDGISGLLDIDQAALPGAGLAVHAKTLRAKANGRRAWKLANKVTRDIEVHGLNGNAPAIAAAAQELIELSEGVSNEGGRITTVHDLPAVCASADTVRFMREPELPEGAIVALAGDSGSGKSTLATAWARDVITAGVPVLILDRESPRSIAMDRMHRLGIADSPLLRWWGGWTGDVPGPASPAVYRWIESCDPRPLIIIDSLIGFIEGDENDATSMRAFFQGIQQLADSAAPRPWLIGHDGK